MPFELRPYPTETLRPDGEYLQKAWAERVLPLAERMGVRMSRPQVSPQPRTHLAHEGMQFAQEHGKANQYNHAVMAAFFQRSEDIGNLDVLTRIAVSVGLDQSEFRRALEERRYREKHQQLLREAYQQLAITAVPTFFIGHRRLQGLYPEQVLSEIIGEELAR